MLDDGKPAATYSQTEIVRLVAKAIVEELIAWDDEVTSSTEVAAIDPAALVLNASARLPQDFATSIQTWHELRSKVQRPWLVHV